jgi:ABC-2 type transport system ATP-binding protein
MGEALSFKNVTKKYFYSHLGKTTVTRGVEELSLSVKEGEAFGLLGLNGSGKTTTFKLALGLLKPTSGEISVFGGAPADKGVHARVGYLPELPYFYPFLTPEESLRFYGRLSGMPEADLPGRIAATLDAVGLTAAAQRKMSGFSKGMVQRVGLAQAILHEPQLLILDEPVSGLDPLAIKHFRELLFGLNAKGKTMIVSSHSISEIEKVCHRVGILKDGRLVRVLEQKDWANGLEDVFVETVQ